MKAPKAPPMALPMLCQSGFANIHCQSFAEAEFPQNAVRAHNHQKLKNRRMSASATF
jgi:hypothetical protein